jgi:hypothetical protein
MTVTIRRLYARGRPVKVMRSAAQYVSSLGMPSCKRCELLSSHLAVCISIKSSD